MNPLWFMLIGIAAVMLLALAAHQKEKHVQSYFMTLLDTIGGIIFFVVVAFLASACLFAVVTVVYYFILVLLSVFRI